MEVATKSSVAEVLVLVDGITDSVVQNTNSILADEDTIAKM
jgi:hypothetical protein